MKLSIKCKLLATKEQKLQLFDTMTIFNRACNYVSQIAFDTKTFNKINLQKIVYYDVRQRFNLSSQMAILIIRKVGDSYADKKTRNIKHTFKKLSAIDYDRRNFSVKKDNVFSINIIGGKIKVSYQSKEKLPDYNSSDKHCSQTELIYDKISNTFYISFCIEKQEAMPIEVENFLGVDLGIVNIATTSRNKIYSSDATEKYRKRIMNLKSKLQSKGTKSAKRHLKKLALKQSRYMKDVNHTISKDIVRTAKALGVGIKLEDLKGITKNTVKKSKAFNQKLFTWAFYQLRTFITYKAKIEGIPILIVNPAYTSQTCSCCGHISKNNRLDQSHFKCTECGHESNADYNAAINISRASINKPIVASDKVPSLELQTAN